MIQFILNDRSFVIGLITRYQKKREYYNNNSSVIIKQPKGQYLSIVCKDFLFSDNSGPYLSLQKFVQ